MENENPKMHRRLEDRLAVAKAGKSLQIVVQGNCRVCKRRSATVPATKTQVMNWFASGDTKGFLKYQIRMLQTGVHRDCQKVEDAKAREKAKRKAAVRPRPAVKVAEVKVENAIARRNKQRRKVAAA